MKDWQSLIEKSRNGDEESTIIIIKKMEPKMKKSLFQTSLQERDNLEQELIIKTIEVVQRFDPSKVPGFWDFFDSNH